jgi:type IV pilus assembly protein PilE
MKKGFTILELIIVIIIIGVLATLGFNQYRNAIENARGAEARSVLSTLRSSQIAYRSEHPVYANLEQINVNAPADCNQTTHYYFYSCDTNTGTCTATRCIAGGKPPAADQKCKISLPIDEPLTEQCGYGV